jgi:hypothetical protein
VLLGPVERQIEFGQTGGGELDGLPTLQDRFHQLWAQEGEVDEASDVAPGDPVTVREAQLATQLLQLVDPDIAAQLAKAVASDQAADPGVRQQAVRVAEQAQRGNAFPVVGSLSDLNSAIQFARRIRGVVPEYTVEIYRTENGDYHDVTLGGYLRLEEALKRGKIARDRKIAADAFVWQSKWGENLLK